MGVKWRGLTPEAFWLVFGRGGGIVLPMDGFWTSFSTWISEKTNSPIYFTYIGFYIAWNWTFFYILFFEDSALIGMPHIQYLAQQTDLHIPMDPRIPQAISAVLDWVVKSVWSLLPPALFTYLALVYLPHLNAWAHNIYLGHYFERKEAFHTAETQFQKKTTAQLTVVAEQKEKQVSAKKRISRAQTQEEKWIDELVQYIQSDKNTQALKAGALAVYQTDGEYTASASDSSYARTFIPADALSRLDAANLIIFSKGDYGQKMSFSDKGKFFLSELQKREKL